VLDRYICGVFRRRGEPYVHRRRHPAYRTVDTISAMIFVSKVDTWRALFLGCSDSVPSKRAWKTEAAPLIGKRSDVACVSVRSCCGSVAGAVRCPGLQRDTLKFFLSSFTSLYFLLSLPSRSVCDAVIPTIFGLAWGAPGHYNLLHLRFVVVGHRMGMTEGTNS
jgi:hypothetical protein